MFISDKSIGSFNINDVTGMSHQFAIWHHKAKKKRMFPVTCQKKKGSIGRDFFFFFFFLREALPCKIPEHRYTV